MAANLSDGDYLGLVLSSALVASVVSGLFSWRIARSNRRQQDRLRAEDAAQAARNQFLPLATDAYDWIRHDFGDRYGMEVGYHGSNAPSPKLGDVAQVIQALNRIEQGHPDENVRVQAHALRGRIDDCFNMHEPGDEFAERPTDEEESDWINERALWLVGEGRRSANAR